MEISKSLQKKFKKSIYSKVLKAIKDHNLIEENDKIAICISGGKDSFLLAKCMEIYSKYNKVQFEYIVMDPGYNKEVLNNIKKNAEILNIQLNIFNSNIFKIIKNKKSPCYICAKMRRGHLYDYAQQLNCNKIALGHHFDDVIETVLMNMFYNGSFFGMPPKIESKNFKNMQLIRPLYYVKEEDIISFFKYHKLSFNNCSCDLNIEKDSKRIYIKNLIKELKKSNKNIDINILNSLHNINLNMTNYKKML